MPNWRGLTAVGALTMMLLTGCGIPSGTDGDLTDDWRAFPEAQSFVPESGVCHHSSEPIGYLTSYNPVDCGQVHRTETVHVGRFTGAHAERGSPPKAGSPAVRAAFSECDAKAKQFVGADWRGARLSIRVILPSRDGWSGGARWFRCDIFELDALDGDSESSYQGRVQRAGSLRDALKKGGSPLAYGCFNEDESENLEPVSCKKPHRFEYAGVWTADFNSYDQFDKEAERIHRRCRSVIASFVKTPDRDMEYRTGTTFRAPLFDAWEQGDRGVLCFLWSDDRVLTRSLKGAGAKALPVG